MRGKVSEEAWLASDFVSHLFICPFPLRLVGLFLNGVAIDEGYLELGSDSEEGLEVPVEDL